MTLAHHRLAVLFVTGAVVLGLEVLASRIMTPYFGVSLYIWAGILTITLVCLAFGYDLGGRWSAAADLLEGRFALCLGVGAASLPAAAFVYPFLLPNLARFDLILGSFVSGAVLMAVPLVALSALNPLLVALRRRRGGDGGAGRVYFVSTLGSVAGVLVTAFVLIPNLSNRSGLLVLGGVLAVLAVLEAVPSRNRRRRLPGAVLGAAAGALSLGLWLAQPGLGRVAEMGVERWRLIDERHSLFGSIKVVEIIGGPDGFARLFFQEGLPQAKYDAQHRSLFVFDHMLTTLARHARPEATGALVVGLGAGTVPRLLSQAGAAVEVVEINPEAVVVARRHFGFPDTIPVRIADARTFVAGCRDRFDVVVLDAFHGDGMPVHLLTREFFADLARCARRDGALIINTFRDGQDPRSFDGLVATLRTAFAAVWTFTLDDSLTNAFLLASNGPLPDAYADARPAGTPTAFVRATLREFLENARRIGPGDLSDVPPVDDESNVFPVLYAEAFLRFRRDVVHWAPPEMLW